MARYIAIAKESTYAPDPGPATPTHWVDVESEDINPDQAWIYPETVSQRDQTRYRIDGPFAVSGSVDTPVYPTSTLTMLYYALGTISTSGGGPTYTHTIDPAVIIPSFKLWVGIEETEYSGPHVAEKILRGCAIN